MHGVSTPWWPSRGITQPLEEKYFRLFQETNVKNEGHLFCVKEGATIIFMFSNSIVDYDYLYANNICIWNDE